ncbi:hypothetical protein ANCCAN_00903 [Ancylostoma caninum]|uniref:Uncharacterized protein n=1 Tax=Ancylostoma caninum TaxID=29170 RepID=A0A368HB38_ANCCA|nr:hypothetical protein ANCCAN_00903 [Ancylostoma caninum]
MSRRATCCRCSRIVGVGKRYLQRKHYAMVHKQSMRSLPADPRAAVNRRSRMAPLTPVVVCTLMCSALAQNYGVYQNFNPNPSVPQYPQYQYQGQSQPSYQQAQPSQYQRDQSLQYQQGQIQQYPQGQSLQYQQGYNKQYPQGQVQQYPLQYQRDQSQLYQQGQNQPYQQGQFQSSNGQWQQSNAQNQWQAPLYNSTAQYSTTGVNQLNYGYQSTTQQPYPAQYDNQPKDCNAPRIRGDFCSAVQQRQMFYYDSTQSEFYFHFYWQNYSCESSAARSLFLGRNQHICLGVVIYSNKSGCYSN